MSSVAIIDYGMGNLHSIAKAAHRVAPGMAIRVTADPATILGADRVIFPGVGAIRDCMAALEQQNLVPVIHEVAKRLPLLGICLGMQALLDRSEENGGTPCLGIIPGEVLRFPEHLTDALGNPLKVPHMGWNQVVPTGPHALWEGMESGSRFYFVHSYYANPEHPSDIAATTAYPHGFTSALARDNICAVQFHPEKSHTAGLRLLSNFLEWKP